jgi:hypothetical protein
MRTGVIAGREQCGGRCNAVLKLAPGPRGRRASGDQCVVTGNRTVDKRLRRGDGVTPAILPLGKARAAGVPGIAARSWALAITALAVGCATCAALWLPARRVTGIDPQTAVRVE